MNLSSQMQWHTKPVGWKVCPVCGCEKVRAGTQHRALTADEGWQYRALWVESEEDRVAMGSRV